MESNINKKESKKKFEEIDKKIILESIRTLSYQLTYAEHNDNEIEVLIRLKQYIDTLYNQKICILKNVKKRELKGGKN